jgi:hypothetical protein
VANQYTADAEMGRLTTGAFYEAQKTFQEINSAWAAVERLMDDAERYAGRESPSAEDRQVARDAVAALPRAVADFEQVLGRKLPVLRRRVERFGSGRA